MINLKINNKEIQVEAGISILKAANTLGISIPTMCYQQDNYSNHPSCMICLVKNNKTSELIPSCAVKVQEGMEIVTNDEEVINARKDALELLLSDHVGDCEAPCRLACPAYMDIPEMNRLIAKGKFTESLIKVKEEIALPLILGYICSAPCENVCRRKQIDEPVSICLLKRFVASEDIAQKSTFFPDKLADSGKKIAIIGTGPAGLSAAFYSLESGHSVTLFDKNEKAGGTLRYAQLNKELPEEILDVEINIIKQYGAEFQFNIEITKEIFENELRKNYDAIIIASGESGVSNPESFVLDFHYQKKTGLQVERRTYATSEPGVFACGNVIRTQKMAIRSVAQGKVAALSANMYLRNEKIKHEPRMFNSKFGILKQEEFVEYLKETFSGKRLEPKKGNIYEFSHEEAINEAKRCMHCDCRAKDDCKLRDYAHDYNADRRKYWPEERKLIKKYNQHESVIYEPEKCIKCGLCIEITKANNEKLGLTHIGRGFDVEINIPFNETIKDALTKTADKCVKACPTGALVFKLEIEDKELE